MTDAEKREKVIRGLEACNRQSYNGSDCQNCPYYDDEDTAELPFGICNIQEMFDDAIAILKKQEARVMTLEELRDVGRVWESSVPPYLWLEKNRSIYNTTSFWVAWRDIYEMIHGRHDKYTDENYGSTWRVWNLQPTPEQKRETKWEEDSDGE